MAWLEAEREKSRQEKELLAELGENKVSNFLNILWCFAMISRKTWLTLSERSKTPSKNTADACRHQIVHCRARWWRRRTKPPRQWRRPRRPWRLTSTVLVFVFFHYFQTYIRCAWSPCRRSRGEVCRQGDQNGAHGVRDVAQQEVHERHPTVRWRSARQ